MEEENLVLDEETFMEGAINLLDVMIIFQNKYNSLGFNYS
jgi:hypothetical protein